MPRGTKKCKGCGSARKLVRIDRYDAMACRNCLTWQETPCSDPKCGFCTTRPPTPEGVDWDDRNNTNY